MFFKFDHLVHFTKSPEHAAKEMIELGFHASLGGHHESWGTYNSLCHFGLPYIEFLGLEHLSIAQNVTHNTLIRQVVDEHIDGGGFMRIALRTDDIEAAAQHFSSLGLKTIGPVEGERRREDGTLLQWAMLFIEDPGSEDPYTYPFIIDWKQPDQERLNSLIDLGLTPPGCPTKIMEIGIGTPQPLETMAKWSSLFQLSSIDKTKVASTEEALDHYQAQIGDTTLVFHFKESDATRPSFLKLGPSNTKGKIDLMGGTYFLS